LTSKARLGIFYSDKEVSSDYHYPLETFTYTPYPEALMFTHFGVGCAYDFTDRILAGLEYHFRDSSTPTTSDPEYGLMYWSLNLGVEARLKRIWSLRTGYIWNCSTENPSVFVGIRDRTKEHLLTLGAGYAPEKSDLCLEMSFRYALKTFKEWYIYANKYQPVEVDRCCFSASVKKSF